MFESHLDAQYCRPLVTFQERPGHPALCADDPSHSWSTREQMIAPVLTLAWAMGAFGRPCGRQPLQHEAEGSNTQLSITSKIETPPPPCPPRTCPPSVAQAHCCDVDCSLQFQVSKSASEMPRAAWAYRSCCAALAAERASFLAAARSADPSARAWMPLSKLCPCCARRRDRW